MWQNDWRNSLWNSLDQNWDVVIVGGGITGAGILSEAARLGLKALLVEAGDFASGTSSRSSKLVHGGLRYLKNGQVRLTIESVHEREHLVKEGRGLVSPLGFLIANYRGDAIPGWIFGAGLILYDLLALKWEHRQYDSLDMHELCHSLTEHNLQGGYRYFDAQTDDARLVLRVVQEAVALGGAALSYARATGLLRTKNGQVCGVTLRDETPEGQGRSVEVRARVVINAAGAWADELRSQVGARSRLRKLRGSHLIFSARRLPLTRAVSFLHPGNGRPVFAFPWEGVTLLGTTDIDHEETEADRARREQGLPVDPHISPAEVEYLLQAAQFAFDHQDLSLADVQSTLSGIRPVIDTGQSDPSKESREHVLWNESGLLTVAGGKLTTFRLMARQALQKVRSRLPEIGAASAAQQERAKNNGHILERLSAEVELLPGLTPAARLRLVGRHGLETPALLAAARPGEFESIGGVPSLWAELRWAARSEAVVHLDDLLLRRVRLGLLLPEGGLPSLERIRSIAQPELGWDDARWQAEAARYTSLWKACYSLP